MASKIFILIVSSLFFNTLAFSQDEPFQQVDALFSDIQPDEPGYGIGIVKNGTLIFSKGYGLSNLDYGIPITDSTVFYIGSVGKQFTAAALLQLKEKGLIDFDDPVSNYLPDFPVYEYPITIRHLIHHVSGIRGTNSLQLFQGVYTSFEEFFDTNDLVELIYNQSGLNFEPGHEYRYSSGCYAVLATIVEEVSGKTFRAYMQDHIFGPLGMKDSFVLDNHNEVIPNRAVSYWPMGDEFERRSLIFEAYGDGGIVTTVRDMAKWDHAFYKDVLGVTDFAQKMYRQGVLNNGEELRYAMAVEVREYKGRKVVLHGGGMLGFRADIVRFPEDSLSVIALSNLAYTDPIGKAFQISDLFLDEQPEQPTQPELKFMPNASSAGFEQWSGKYFSEEINQWRRISFTSDSLFFDSGNLQYRNYLAPMTDSVFHPVGYDRDSRIQLRVRNNKKQVIYTDRTVTRTFIEFDDTLPSDMDEITRFEGTYYSTELDTRYRFFSENNRFLLQINRNDPVELYPNPEDSRINWNSKTKVWIGFAMITFLEDSATGTISGIEVGDYRVNGVLFKKTEP